MCFHFMALALAFYACAEKNENTHTFYVVFNMFSRFILLAIKILITNTNTSTNTDIYDMARDFVSDTLQQQSVRSC